MILASAPSSITQMLGSGLIGLREGLETGIVVMILVAFLVKSGRRDALKFVWLGVGLAVAMVGVVFGGIQLGTQTVSGIAAEKIAGAASLVAVVIVTVMVLWMKSAAASISGELRSSMGRALEAGGAAVVALSFLAVGREGIETALLMVNYAESSTSVLPLVGLLLGILAAVGLTVLLYFGAISINFARFFRYTGLFLVFVAAGILAYGVRALQTVQWLPGLDAIAFRINGYDQSSWYGTVLAGIFNFRPDPTVWQAVAWLTYVVVVGSLFLINRGASTSRASRTRHQTVAVDSKGA